MTNERETGVRVKMVDYAVDIVTNFMDRTTLLSVRFIRKQRNLF